MACFRLYGIHERPRHRFGQKRKHSLVFPRPVRRPGLALLVLLPRVPLRSTAGLLSPMFPRHTRVRRSPSKVDEYVQLVESYRDDQGRGRQRVVVSLA